MAKNKCKTENMMHESLLSLELLLFSFLFLYEDFLCPSKRLTFYRLLSYLTSHVSLLMPSRKKQSWLLFTCPGDGVAITRFDAGHETRDVSKRHETTGHKTQVIAWCIVWLRLDYARLFVVSRLNLYECNKQTPCQVVCEAKRPIQTCIFVASLTFFVHQPDIFCILDVFSGTRWTHDKAWIGKVPWGCQGDRTCCDEFWINRSWGSFSSFAWKSCQ